MDSNLIVFFLYTALVLNAILSAVLFSRGIKNVFNILFSLIAFGVAVWCVAIAGFYTSGFQNYADWLKWTHSSALFISMVFVYFSNVFPRQIVKNKLAHFLIFIPFAIAVYYIFQTHYIVGRTQGIFYDLGQGYIFYQLLLIAYFFVGYVLLFMQYRRATDLVHKQQVKYVLMGAILSSALAMVTNLVFPYLHIFSYTWLGPIFTLALVASIFMAILRYNLFSIKVVVAELFSLIVLVILIVDAYSTGASNLFVLAVKSLALIVVSIFLYLFIRGVYRLEDAIKQQESLIHFISHEVKSYLTKSEGVFSGIVEGDYGSVPDEIKSIAEGALKEDRKGVKAVTDILLASNQRKGTITFKMEPFDFKEMVEAEFNELKDEAQAKGLKFELHAADAASYKVLGDRGQIGEHVMRNLLKNAILYTPSGSVVVYVSAKAGSVECVVKDTGVGITPEDKARLFTEGGHGKDSVKINTNSTGYGLFIAKGIMDAHQGKIWAESDGAGKGSAFFIAMPIADAAHGQKEVRAA